MQHFVYPEDQYKRTDHYGTLKVDHDPDNDLIRVIIINSSSGSRMIRLPMEAAAMVAGFLLSKQPAIVKNDAMAFSNVARAANAIGEPDFTVIPPGHELLAKAKAAIKAANDGAQPLPTATQHKEVSRLKVPDSAPVDTGLLHPDQRRRLTALREAAEIIGGRLNNDRVLEWAGWILNGDTEAGQE